uniref:Uncharacterized protein n=1 Tax=Arundo donax TaxID=35708 RepID=A0A0A9BLV4_ARUDO
MDKEGISFILVGGVDVHLDHLSSSPF